MTAVMTLTLFGEGPTSSEVEITSYGVLRGHPEGDAYVVDVSNALRNPHEDPRMRYMTALDPEVYAHVMLTPGALDLAAWTAARLLAMVRIGDGAPVRAYFACRGGRHRAPSLAWSVALTLWREGITVHVTHRDIDKPVIQRV